MPADYLQVHPGDDVVVALRDLPPGGSVKVNGSSVALQHAIPAKHKAATRAIRAGERVRMYGILVGRAVHDIAEGSLISTQNLQHATEEVSATQTERPVWQMPDIRNWKNEKFEGFVDREGRFGTRNYWLVAPLVFCENRNIRTLRRALLEELGYGATRRYQQQTRQLVEQYQQGATIDELRSHRGAAADETRGDRVFPQVDGVRFLTHVEGCGGAYEDAENLCGLLAGYIDHPNVAGATILSLGCQKSEVALLEQQIHRRNPDFAKPLYIFDQQTIGEEQQLIDSALRATFTGLVEANRRKREPAPLEALTLGVECGGSDGFSGISANPAIGHASDMIASLGGSVILSEFPELAGCEADIVSRCVDPEAAERFLALMSGYEKRLAADGVSFESNPSPGNVRDGLITDAMKSAGAARKGGRSPVVDVLDYPEPAVKRGLNLLCTPGGDVESTTAMVGSGANVVAFSTGLGTPTGNVIAPVLKIATNTTLATRMPDIIDLDAGPIIEGEASIEQIGERLLQLVVATASGTYSTKAERLGQEDFIPWRRCLSF